MIYLARAEEVETWFVSFHRECSSSIWQRLIPGRFKHVRAFAWCEGVRAWVFFDVWFMGGAKITLSPGGAEGDALIGQYIAGASVLKLRRLPPFRPPLSTLIGFWCVPATRRLLNLPGGALRPDALWRDCLAHGAEIVADGHSTAAAGPCAAAAAGDGAEDGDTASPVVARPADTKPVVDVRQWDAA